MVFSFFLKPFYLLSTTLPEIFVKSRGQVPFVSESTLPIEL
jgi:hypothetical protein